MLDFNTDMDTGITIEQKQVSLQLTATKQYDYDNITITPFLAIALP